MSEDDSPRELAEDLMESIDDDVVDIEIDSLEERFEQYQKYDVGGGSARQSIARQVASEHDVEVDEMMDGSSGEGSVFDIDDINEPDNFITIEAEVNELWDSDSDAISQVGLLHDNTGRIKFVSWSKSEVPLLTEGETYQLESVVTDEYNGRMSVNLNSQTEVDIIDEEFEAPDNTESIRGALVDLHSGSGLIRRCTVEDCNRVLDGGECKEHGDVEGEFDLRLKGVIDNGDKTRDVIIGRELTEKMTGIPIEEAKQMAQDALDTDVVGQEMASRVLLRYYEFEGWLSDINRLVVQEAEPVEEMEDSDLDELLVRASSLQSHDTEQEEATEVN